MADQDMLDAEPLQEEQTVVKIHPDTSTKPGSQNLNVQNGTGSDIIISRTLFEAESYKFKSGIAVVINNKEFDPRLNLPDRIGSDVDAASLFQRFQELDFESDLLNDASTGEMMDKFKEIKDNKEALKEADCLIVALLTHGKEGVLYTTDGEIKITSLLYEFSAENCPELRLKPKIFIIQACRGSAVGSGVNLKVIRDADPNQADAAAVYEEYDQTFGQSVRIPNDADFLTVFASSEGYGAFRNTKDGSPFVRVLSEELLKMRKGEDFYKILTKVNRRVGTEFIPKFNQTKNATQMPCFVSHLTKDLVLKP